MIPSNKEIGSLHDYFKPLASEIDSNACVTGKPLNVGGIAGRTEATGRGIQYALREFFRHPEDVAKANLKDGLEGKRVIIQGLGNVGYHASHFLSTEDGVLITGLCRTQSDSKELFLVPRYLYVHFFANPHQSARTAVRFFIVFSYPNIKTR